MGSLAVLALVASSCGASGFFTISNGHVAPALLTVALLTVEFMQTCPEPDIIDQTSTLMFALAGEFENIFDASANGAHPQLPWKQPQASSCIICISRHCCCSPLAQLLVLPKHTVFCIGNLYMHSPFEGLPTACSLASALEAGTTKACAQFVGTPLSSAQQGLAYILDTPNEMAVIIEYMRNPEMLKEYMASSCATSPVPSSLFRFYDELLTDGTPPFTPEVIVCRDTFGGIEQHPQYAPGFCYCCRCDITIVSDPPLSLACGCVTIDRGAKQIIVNSMWMLLTILVPANFCCLTAQFPGMLSPSEHLSVKRAISTYSSCCKGTADTCRW